MEYIQSVLLVVGVIVLVVGYRKNQRNLLLSAAVVLFLAGTVGNFTQGFLDGFNAAGSSSALSAK
ncbi:MAG TPA: hypothetical protein VFE77_03575 [Rhodanobacter sp.]|nr:hypothetical protein [Rhodanobacter sp.]